MISMTTPLIKVPIMRYTAFARIAPDNVWLVRYTVIIAHQGFFNSSRKAMKSDSITAMKQFTEKMISRKPTFLNTKTLNRDPARGYQLS